MSTADVKVLVIGAGSIGCRHARNLIAAGAAVTLTDPVDGRAEVIEGARPVPFDDERWQGYDGIVVASPTIYHLDHAASALASGAKVLVEKPLAASSEGVDGLVESGPDRIMVGFNLRVHEPVQRFVRLAGKETAGRVSSVRVWFGSWLPDWRPAADYRTTYSARRDLGGGILLDASHELDLLCWLIGTPLLVAGAVVGRLGALDIDVEDTVNAVLIGPGPGALLGGQAPVVAELSLDYLSRAYRRGVEVVGDRATVRLDWSRRSIEVEDGSGREIFAADEPIDRSYEREVDRFLAWITDGTPPPVDGRAGAASVHLADQIKLRALGLVDPRGL